MIKVVPTLSGPNVTTLAYDLLFDMISPEGPATYRFLITYNQRIGCWVLSIYDSREDLIIAGAPIILCVNLLEYAKPGKKPKGFLTAIWNSNADTAEEPGQYDLGEAYSLVYFERLEDLDDAAPIEFP